MRWTLLPLVSDRKRLLVFAPSAYPLGGVADWLDYTLAGLEGLGWGCRLFVVEGSGHDPTRYFHRHAWPGAGVVSNPSGSREGRVRSFARVLNDICPDVVLSVNLADVYEAVRRLRWRNRQWHAKVALALHGLESCLLSDIGQEADLLDGVIGTNRLSVAVAREAGIAPERVQYAPYGVPGVPLDHCVIHRRPLRLLYAGRIEQEQKRVLDLALILRGVVDLGVDARLSVAGSGPSDFEFRSLIESCGLSSIVEWLGELNSASLGRAYRSHDALVITSEWETGPIVAWEAMSHGLPVVSSRYIGSGLEGALVDGGTALLFDVGDIAGAVQTVARLRDDDLRRSIIAGGHALVSERYSRKASVSAWDRALTSVLDAPALPATQPRLSAPSGRLDRWFGVERAEDFRRLLRIRFVPDSPGAAWPHTGSSSSGQAAFLDRARLIDRGVARSP